MVFGGKATFRYAASTARTRVAIYSTVEPAARFEATHGSALFGVHLPAETIRQIIHHAAEGVGVRATARLLELDKDTVNRVILRAGQHCAHVLSSLLTSLHMTEAQLDELWTFVKKRKVLAPPKTSHGSMGERGSGQPSTPPLV